MANIFEKVEYIKVGHNNIVEVFINPVVDQYKNALSQHRSLRGFIFGNSLYMWNSYDACHSQIRGALGFSLYTGIDFEVCNFDNAFATSYSDKGFYVDIEDMAVANSNKRFVELVGELSPLPNKIEEQLKQADTLGKDIAKSKQISTEIPVWNYKKERQSLTKLFSISDKTVQNAIQKFTSVADKYAFGEVLDHLPHQKNILKSLQKKKIPLDDRYFVFAALRNLNPTKYIKNGVLTWDNFMEATLSLDAAIKVNNRYNKKTQSREDHILHFALPKGYYGCFYIADYSSKPEELEMLLFPGQKFKQILKKTIDLGGGQKRYIWTLVPMQMTQRKGKTDVLLSENADLYWFWYHPEKNKMEYVENTHSIHAHNMGYTHKLSDEELQFGLDFINEESLSKALEDGWVRGRFGQRKDNIDHPWKEGPTWNETGDLKSISNELSLQGKSVYLVHKTALKIMKTGARFSKLYVDFGTSHNMESMMLAGDRLTYFLKYGRIPGSMVLERQNYKQHHPSNCWILPDGAIKYLNRDAGQWHAEIAAEVFPGTSGQYSADLAIEHGWIRVYVPGDHGSINIQFNPKAVTRKSISKLFSFLNEDFPKYVIEYGRALISEAFSTADAISKIQQILKRYQHISEAPVMGIFKDINSEPYDGEYRKPADYLYTKGDQRYINNPKYNDIVIKKLSRTPFDLYIYIVAKYESNNIATLPSNSDIFSRYFDPNYKSIKELRPLLGDNLKTFLDNPNAVHLLITHNDPNTLEHVRLTPWMLLHRLAHACLDYGQAAHTDFPDVSSVRQTFGYVDDELKKFDLTPVEINLAKKNDYNKVFNFKTAKNYNGDDYEFCLELFVCYCYNGGRIPFTNHPNPIKNEVYTTWVSKLEKDFSLLVKRVLKGRMFTG